MANKIHHTAIIYPNVEIGDNVEIGAYCIIGAPAEDKKSWGAEKFSVEIGDNIIITGHVTIDAGTVRHTSIRDNCFIMKGCHIGHDAVINDNCTLSPHVVIGGHAILANNVNMGIASVVHQRCKIEHNCMIGMNATITKQTNTQPFGCYVGTPARWLRENKR